MRHIELAQSVDLSWPYLEEKVKCPGRALLARRLFLASVRSLRLSVVMSSGEVFGAGRGGFESGGDPELHVLDEECFFSRLGRDGALGFGESYLVGAWRAGGGSSAIGDSDELAAWLATYAAALRKRESRALMQLRRMWHRELPISEGNSAAGARRNVGAHYDLDHRLFKLFLDQSMTYSSALFDSRPTPLEGTDELTAAQVRKIDSILNLAQVEAGGRLLDIGSGFGALAIRAARERQARVTGITLSERQLQYATGVAKGLHLSDAVEFRSEDYREHSGSYDSIVSVEMIEAVGSAYWPDFFATVDRLLAPGGHFALQVITFPHERMIAAAHDFSWVDRYIFPGGALPSLRRIWHIVEDSTNLEITRARKLTDSYSRTLREWRHRFIAVADEVKALGFDEVFVRLWILYFAYFEAGFRSRYCDVWQLAMRKTA